MTRDEIMAAAKRLNEATRVLATDRVHYRLHSPDLLTAVWALRLMANYGTVNERDRMTLARRLPRRRPGGSGEDGMTHDDLLCEGCRAVLETILLQANNRQAVAEVRLQADRHRVEAARKPP